MKKLFVVNTTVCSVRQMTEKAFLNEFQKCVPTPNGVEPEFQYDEEMQYLFQWQRGQKYIFENEVAPEYAYARLLHWTIQDAENDPDETIRVFDSKQEALEFIDFSISFVYEEDDPNVAKLSELRNTLEQMQ